MAKNKTDISSVSTTLKLEKKCKSCVRYSTEDKTKEGVTLTIYLVNEAVAKLGEPQKINITVSAAD